MENKWHPAVAAQQREERLLRPDQVAARLNCTTRWVTQLCQDKLLKAIKVGRRQWQIPESAIREYLEAINGE